MPELAREPSMEDILASIKRIIADDGAAASAAAAGPRVRRGPMEVPPAAPPEADEVLELTEPVAPVTAAAPEPAPPTAEPAEPELPAAPPPSTSAPAAAAEPAVPSATILSEQAANASRQSLAALSALVVTPEPGQNVTLEGLVRELLRPMLKDWLDARLPELVEGMVAREIARITGRAL